MISGFGVTAVSAFRASAKAAGATSLHLARQLPGEYAAMLDQVEVTVAADPLPRLRYQGPLHVTAWARRNHYHAAELAQLATASRWDTDPTSTAAVARSIQSHLPTGGAPLWLGFKHVGRVGPTEILAALG